MALRRALDRSLARSSDARASLQVELDREHVGAQEVVVPPRDRDHELCHACARLVPGPRVMPSGST